MKWQMLIPVLTCFSSFQEERSFSLCSLNTGKNRNIQTWTLQVLFCLQCRKHCYLLSSTRSKEFSSLTILKYYKYVCFMHFFPLGEKVSYFHGPRSLKILIQQSKLKGSLKYTIYTKKLFPYYNNERRAGYRKSNVLLFGACY